MLYIASSLTPTPISHAVRVPDFTAPGVTSIVLAKPDCIEVWDITATGLVFREQLKVWGTIVGLAAASVPDARPHVLVLVGPPHAQLHLVTFSNGLVITSTQPLAPPTPALRRQEFFSGVVSLGTSILVSLWTGLLAHVELELEKSRDAKRRTSTAGKDMDVDEGRRLVFKNSFNINIREHNLLDISVVAGDPTVVTFLWQSENNKIQLQPRQFQPTHHSFADLAPATDVVNPLDFPVNPEDEQEIDFASIPFSCPAGRNILAVGNGPNSVKLFLVTGDEHSVLYAVTPGSPASHKSSTSPRASAVRRSPQSETGGVGKKRKSSTSGRGVVTDVESNWSVKPVWRVRQGWGVVLASTVLDNHVTGASVLIGDECGRLKAVGWEFEGENVRVGMIDMGVVSPPTALVYLDNGNLFAPSACGDSLLVDLKTPTADAATKLSSSSGAKAIENKGKGRAQQGPDGGAWAITMQDDAQGSVDIRERWMNIAPVKDFTIVEGDDGHLSHVVVASGSSNTNSLRIVRSGVGLEDILTVEGLPGVERLWPLSLGRSNSGHSTLLLSFAESSVILSLYPEVSALAVADPVTSSPTIAAGLVKGDTVLAQVTPLGVQLWSDVIAGNAIGSFLAPADNGIVTAAVCDSLIVAAFRDGSIKAWDASSSFEQVLDTQAPREVASVAISRGDEVLIAMSDWSGDIQIFTLQGIADNLPLASAKEAVYATSLLFNSTTSTRKLLAGLSDGSYVSYILDERSIASQLRKGRIQSTLGTRPLLLVPLDLQSGDETVFAAGISERLSILFQSRDHVEVSASGKKDVMAAASISNSTLGDCIALATPDGLCFSRLSSLKKLQVQTLDLYDTSPVRIARVPDLKLIAVGTVTRTLDAESGELLQASGVEIRNDTTLDLLADLQLGEREAVASVNAVLLNGRRYIVAGTAIFDSDDAADIARLDEPSSYIAAKSGRLLLLEAQESGDKWSLDIVTSLDTPAPVYDTAVIHGFLAAAMSTKMSILRLEGPPTNSLTEVSKSTFAFDAHYVNPTTVKADETERLVVGDFMRSIIVLEVDKESGQIRSDQRNMSTHQVRALANVVDGGPGVMISNDYANLLTFRLNDQVEPAAMFGLHEDIARLRPGSLVPLSAAPEVLRPDLLFATANGRLGIIGELGRSATRTLDDLQRNMNKYNKGPGNLDWRAFRRGGNMMVPKETVGFIDGDFVQSFAELDTDAADKLLRGSTAVESVFKMTDGGKESATRGDVVRVLEAAAGMH